MLYRASKQFDNVTISVLEALMSNDKDSDAELDTESGAEEEAGELLWLL